MLSSKCPGQDTRYWTADDIHEQPCPNCGAMIEFWKTDIRVRCPRCRQKAANPRFNLGCAQWCAYAEQCLGGAATGGIPRSFRQVLESELSRLAHGLPFDAGEIRDKLSLAEEECRKRQLDPLPVMAAVVMLKARELGRLDDARGFMNTLIREHGFPAAAEEETMSLIRKVSSGHTEGAKEKLTAALHGAETES